MKKILLVISLIVLAGIGFFAYQTVTQKVIPIESLVKKLEKVRTAGGGIQAYPPPPATLEMTDQEINAVFDVLCGADRFLSLGQRLGLLKEGILANLKARSCQDVSDFKIKFEEGQYTVQAKLLKPVQGEVKIEGRILLIGQRNAEVKLENGFLNNQPLPLETSLLLENVVTQAMNQILDQMNFVALESLTVSPGHIAVKGVFSLDELLCLLGAKDYCLPVN